MGVDIIDPGEFVTTVQPLLEAQDPAALLQVLKSRWHCGQITELLTNESCDVRKLAALSLALVGGRCCIEALASQLKNPDPMVNQMAEHALWSIWFRSGTIEANHELCLGTRELNRKDYDHGLIHFSRAIELDPSFAEAYNQRAIAKYLQERYDESLEDCTRAVERMPCHFGAWSGMGHCHAQEGRFREALDCYCKTLSINPHFGGIRQAVCELKRRLA